MRPNTSERTGAAIRKLRLAKGWTLAEMANHSGIPLSTLSRVELGQNALNYDKLVRLCRALEVDLQGLVAREADAAIVPTGRRVVVRAGTGEPIQLGGNVGKLAAGDLLAKNFSPLIVEVAAASLEEHGPLVILQGEAYVLVLIGEVVFHNHLYAPLPLGIGDAVYFDGASGHALIAPKGSATVLLVSTGELSIQA